MAQGAVIARIISQYSDKGSKAAQKDIKQLGAQFTDFGKKVEKAFGLAAVAGIAFATTIGVSAVKAAIADQQQQATLAKALENTTGASKAQIAAVEEHIRKTQLLLGVQDEQLRPSMGALLAATHSISAATKLQNVALDVSAGTGRDLTEVSLALAKAHNGNFGALTRLGVAVDHNIIKTKDFTKLIEVLNATYGGQAAVRADTFAYKIERIRLAFDEAKKSLGYALLPALTNLANKVTEMLPKIDEWVATNKDKLAKGLQHVADTVVSVVTAAINFGKWIANHMGTVKAFGIMLASMFVYVKVFEFATALMKIVTAFRAIKAAAETAAVFEALATGGASLAAGFAALAVAGIGAAWLLAGNQADDASSKFEKAGRSVSNGRGGILHGFGDTKPAQEYSNNLLHAHPSRDTAGIKSAQKQLDLAKQIAAQNKADAAAAAKASADAARKAAEAARVAAAQQKALNLLKALGITPVTAAQNTANEYEAARLNLVKQNNLLELDKLAALKKNVELQEALNADSARYADILQAISATGGTLSTAQIEVLAAKWGTTSDKVEEYVTRIYAANSTPTNHDSVVALLEQWGLTKTEAEKYITFAKALGDEKLSDEEIKKLGSQWGLSKANVEAYALSIVNGSIFSDAVLANWASPGNSATKSLNTAQSAAQLLIATLNSIHFPSGIVPPIISSPDRSLGKGGDQGPGAHANDGNGNQFTNPGLVNYVPSYTNAPQMSENGGGRGTTTTTKTLAPVVLPVIMSDSAGFQSAVQSAVQKIATNGDPTGRGSNAWS